jgi:predicted TIM-barrel fold metal-dependent hydrolase
MNTHRLQSLIAIIAGGVLLTTPPIGPALLAAQPSAQPKSSSSNTLLASFAAVDPIDAHVHVYTDDLRVDTFLKQYNLHFVDIAVVDDRDPFYKALEPQLQDVLALVHSSGGHTSLCTTFSPYDFEKPGFSQRVIRQLNENFSEGAVAVKIYKTIGMEIKKTGDGYLMPDDPVFEPIYLDIAAHNRTVIAHLAEPTSCWLPPDPASVDYEYYRQHPGEYAYKHPEWPSKAAILTARDHMLAENPKLRVVGAHLGSMELDVNEIAKRFDLYPNFAVDTAARVPYLMFQPREKVRSFLIKYQDRVLYGTDIEILPGSHVEASLNQLKNTYARDWKYFATDEILEYQGKEIQGLGLPPSVLRKLYHDNAVRWFPEMRKGGRSPTA